MSIRKFSPGRRCLSLALALIHVCFLVIHPQSTQAQSLTVMPNSIPALGGSVPPAQQFSPPIMAGMTIHPGNPLHFDFIIDQGDRPIAEADFRGESEKLVSYFMASLTVPEDEMWVNLSPTERDRIVAKGLGGTTMGRDMLAQDYLLKQLTAAMLHPENEHGKKIWEKMQAANLPMNVINKVWIVPQRAEIYIHGRNVFVADARLKVMMEGEYKISRRGGFQTRPDNWTGLKPVPTLEATDVIHDTLIPALEHEVNHGESFANLRQIYHAMILAAWYKKELRASLEQQETRDKTQDTRGKTQEASHMLQETRDKTQEASHTSQETRDKAQEVSHTSQETRRKTQGVHPLKHIIDQNKTRGVEYALGQDEPSPIETIYNQYLEAFKQGAFDYIKEEYDPAARDVTARHYFSGGEDFQALSSAAMTRSSALDPTSWLMKRLVDSPAMSTVSVQSELVLEEKPDAAMWVRPGALAGNVEKPRRQDINLDQVYAGMIAATIKKYMFLEDLLKGRDIQIGDDSFQVLMTKDQGLYVVGPVVLFVNSVLTRYPKWLRNKVYPKVMDDVLSVMGNYYKDRKDNIIFVPPGGVTDIEHNVDQHTWLSIAGMIKYAELFKEATVIDGGAGYGILSILALNLGAKEVILLERETNFRKLAVIGLEKQGFRKGVDFKVRKVNLEDQRSMKRILKKIGAQTSSVIGIGNLGASYGLANESFVRFMSHFSNLKLLMSAGHYVGREGEGNLIGIPVLNELSFTAPKQYLGESFHIQRVDYYPDKNQNDGLSMIIARKKDASAAMTTPERDNLERDGDLERAQAEIEKDMKGFFDQEMADKNRLEKFRNEKRPFKDDGQHRTIIRDQGWDTYRSVNKANNGAPAMTTPEGEGEGRRVENKDGAAMQRIVEDGRTKAVIEPHTTLVGITGRSQEDVVKEIVFLDSNSLVRNVSLKYDEAGQVSSVILQRGVTLNELPEMFININERKGLYFQYDENHIPRIWLEEEGIKRLQSGFMLNEYYQDGVMRSYRIEVDSFGGKVEVYHSVDHDEIMDVLFHLRGQRKISDEGFSLRNRDRHHDNYFMQGVYGDQLTEEERKRLFEIFSDRGYRWLADALDSQWYLNVGNWTPFVKDQFKNLWLSWEYPSWHVPEAKSKKLAQFRNVIDDVGHPWDVNRPEDKSVVLTIDFDYFAFYDQKKAALEQIDFDRQREVDELTPTQKRGRILMRDNFVLGRHLPGHSEIRSEVKRLIDIDETDRDKIIAVHLNSSDQPNLSRGTPVFAPDEYSLLIRNELIHQYGQILGQPVLKKRSSEERKVLKLEELELMRSPFFAHVDPNRDGAQAMTSGESDALKEAPGGIDFNSGMLEIKESGDVGNRLKPLFTTGDLPAQDMDPAMLASDNVLGIRPVIINIRPVTNLPMLLGLVDEEKMPLADEESDSAPVADHVPEPAIELQAAVRDEWKYN